MTYVQVRVTNNIARYLVWDIYDAFKEYIGKFSYIRSYFQAIGCSRVHCINMDCASKFKRISKILLIYHISEVHDAVFMNAVAAHKMIPFV